MAWWVYFTYLFPLFCPFIYTPTVLASDQKHFQCYLLAKQKYFYHSMLFETKCTLNTINHVDLDVIRKHSRPCIEILQCVDLANWLSLNCLHDCNLGTWSACHVASGQTWNQTICGYFCKIKEILHLVHLLI